MRDDGEAGRILETARARFVAELDRWCSERGNNRRELDNRVVAIQPLSTFEAIGSP